MAINDWKGIMDCPVVDVEKGWNFEKLEHILQNAIVGTSSAACVLDVEMRRKNKTRWYASPHSFELESEIFMGLSGGIDSTFCLSQIKNKLFFEEGGQGIRTYTIGPHKEYPDIKYALAISILFDTNHHELILDEKARAENLNEFNSIFPEPRYPGDDAVYRLFKELKKDDCYAAICCDGIDELLGGYWPHQVAAREGREKLIETFKKFWAELFTAHLAPLQRTADHFGIKLFFPYLQRSVVEYISHIPVLDRCPVFTHGKEPLRKIAEKHIPVQIIWRGKRGFGQALDPWPQ